MISVVTVTCLMPAGAVHAAGDDGAELVGDQLSYFAAPGAANRIIVTGHRREQTGSPQDHHLVPAELRAVLEWSLEHEASLTSIFGLRGLASPAGEVERALLEIVAHTLPPRDGRKP